MDLLTPSSPGGLPSLSLTSNSSWLPWERVAIRLTSRLMPVPQGILIYNVHWYCLPRVHMHSFCCYITGQWMCANGMTGRQITDKILQWSHNDVNSTQKNLYFNGHFLGGPELASTKVSPFWMLLKLMMMEVVVATWAIGHAPPTYQHSTFYKLDALPATQPTVSEHWRHPAHRKLKKIILSNRCWTDYSG